MRSALGLALMALSFTTGSAEQPVEVGLVVTEPLRLVRWAVDGAPDGPVALEGKVAVTVTNTGESPVTLLNLAEHGLVFLPAGAGAPFVVVHPCTCVKDAHEPAGTRLRLEPGGVHWLELDDFGCGGGPWQPPPPGDYTLEYRVLPAPEETPPPSEEPPSVLVPRCRRQLASPDFWHGAVASAPVAVTLGNPVPIRVE